MAPTPFSDNTGRSNKDAVNVNQIHAAILREQKEPEDGFEALPTAWLMCMLGLALTAGWYFGAYTADFSPSRLDGDSFAASGAQSGPAVAQAPPDPKVVGKRIYNSCMACHQGDGKGVSGQFPPLAQSEWVLGNEHALARILLHGLQGDVQVLSKHYNGVMPAWQRLSDVEIAGVLTYIRGAFGNTASAIEPDVIAQARKEEGAQHGPWSEAELRKLGFAP